MPEMSGRELAQRLPVPRPDMKVLSMSGYTDDALVRHGVLGVGLAFLPKPFTPDTLATSLREILDAPRRASVEAATRSPTESHVQARPRSDRARPRGYLTVTLLARFRGLSGSWPRKRAR